MGDGALTVPTSADPSSFIDGDASTDALDATAVIRAACGWHIATEVEEVDVEIDVAGGRTLALPTLRLNSVSSVTATATGEPVAAWDAANGWSRAGLLRCDAGWPVGFRAVTVSFTHGYSEVPADLAAAARSLARHINTHPDQAPVSSFTKAQGSKSLTKAFAITTVANLVGQLSFVERLVIERYSLGALP